MKSTLLVVLMLVLPCTVLADVVASVDDATLTWEDILSMIGGEQNVQYLGINSESSASEILQSWVREEVLVRAAQAEGLDSDPDVQEAIRQSTRQILLQAYMSEIVQGLQPSQLEIDNYTDEWLDTYKKEIHIRHIVVDDPNLANSLLARIRAGGDFAALAQQYSMGPAASNGGDLDWISRGQSGYMDFDEAAFRLGDGEVSDVVETDAGYHIIKVLESRPLSPEPTDDAIKQEVAQELTQAMQEDAIMAKVESLETQHDVQLYPERLLDHLQ